MAALKIGVLHPGAMGASVCAALASNDIEVVWLSEGRSAATRQRAQQFSSVDNLQTLLDEVDGIVSVCPPDAAEALAQEVIAAGYQGIYVDANAISPQRAERLAKLVGDGYVDGGIVGPPAWSAGTTRLYLSGGNAETVSAWFDGSLLEPVVMGEGVSAASSLKMCYAAYTKGSSALLLAVRALAEQQGVAEELTSEWQRSQPGLDKRVHQTARGVAPKAWRFEGEMREIASTFEAAGLPDGFHQASAELYAGLAGLKDLSDVDLQQVLDVLCER